MVLSANVAHHKMAAALYRLFPFDSDPHEFVMEVRPGSRLTDKRLPFLTKYAVGLVISEPGKVFPYSEMVTAKNVYLRFHGPEDLYASVYSDRMLQAFANKL